MALTTYSELQTAIADWLSRSDLDTFIPDFITIVEKRLNRDPRLQIRGVETRVTPSTVASQTYYDLPAGFRGFRRFRLDTSPKTSLEYVTPEEMDRKWAGSLTGKPLVYTIEGTEYRLGPTPDAVYTMNQLYWKDIDVLSDSNTSNFWLTNAPDALLFGALLEAEPFLKDEKGYFQVWENKYNRAIDELIRESEGDLYSGSALVVRPDQPIV